MADDERDDSGQDLQASEQDEELLQEIRDRYRYYDDAWREIREESRIDRKYLSGDPWDEKDRAARENAGRPCINHDELNQYVNQATNNLRLNKRGIKVNPGGNGATEKTAEFRQNLIRGIEYRSHAQNAYVTAFENMLEGSYGYCRVSRRYVNRRKNKDQEIVIKNIANPDSVLYDPDCKEADWSDGRGCFVLDPIPREEFKRRYPKAQIKDFTAEHMRIAKDWLQDQQVLVAEYWRVTGDEESGLEVTQYITNGVEILERLPQPGEHIPIIPFVGKQRYIDEGGVAKRKLFSLVRLARDPQLSLAFLVTQQMEEAGQTPKSPYVGYKGQFEADAEAWENANRVPRAFLQVDPITDSSNGQILPLPRRESFTPNFQGYEMAKDSSRRAIQAAMGISPLPTAAQRNNEKSGVALERINQQQDLGSFHFVDNFDRALEFAGRVIEEWIPVVYDTEREIALRMPDDSHRVVRINTAAPYLDTRTNQMVHYPLTDEEADHDLEISTGPSYQSQREEAASFLDTLIQNLATLPVPPPQQAKLLALAIQMRQLGPKGDEMAQIISPSSPDQAQQAGQQLAAAQQQLQAQGVLVQQLQAELQKLTLEKQGKLLDNQARMAIEKMKIEAQLAIAEVQTKSQELAERAEFIRDLYAKLVDQGHDMRTLAAEHVQERAMAQPPAAAAAPQPGAPPAV